MSHAESRGMKPRPSAATADQWKGPNMEEYGEKNLVPAPTKLQIPASATFTDRALTDGALQLKLNKTTCKVSVLA